ncbi:MAG: hypothetical protein ACUVX8_08650 [Candidatus Zipacnadales bacterium]
MACHLHVPHEGGLAVIHLSALIVIALLLPNLWCSAGESRTYITCDQPITCCVSYETDVVTVELHTPKPSNVSVWIGFRPTWALLGGRPTKTGWSYKTEGMVLIEAVAGAFVWEFGRGHIPLRGDGPLIPIKVDGKQQDPIRTTYAPRRMEARGVLRLPLALYTATLVYDYPIPHNVPNPRLRLGGADIMAWDKVMAPNGRQALRVTNILCSGSTGIQLSWHDDFTRSPIRSILLETVAQPTELAKTDAPNLEADGVIIIEAEDFAREGGGGPVQISKGQHADQHGGASIYSFGPGDEHWLEWRFEVPTDGRYALYARTATQEERSLRQLTIDGEFPDPNAALLSFPGTGGWARENPNQWVWTALAGADGRPPLKLTAGQHRLRLTTRGIWHLNLDLMALVPLP